ncbi:MAG: hypothetical protein NT084_08045 [Bacteroidetes bacterium]|nr:hypothetical protein [Bacteroidota bacterium]
MKNIFLLLSCMLVGSAFATPNIHEALKNPSAITVLALNGTSNEASLLIKNASKFSALNKIIISGISDSIIAEQDFVAVAACSKVSKLSIEKCNFSHLSGAVKMLVSINDLEISNCDKLEINSTFTTLAGMPSLNSISYSANKLTRIPQSFTRMRGMKKISITNNDLSLADGYALNNSSRESLFAKEELELGFGNYALVLKYGCYDKTSAKEHISIMRDMLQGAVGMNGEMILPQRAKAFTRENSLVRPPISGLDVQKNIYSTNAATGGLVEYPSGTKIIIPDHAFVDANGNEVSGNVTIDYREFRDQVDILVSGIPMVYDSAGQKGDFQSAGMFELNASVNGQEVFLAPNKKVDLEFAVVDSASSYNFYRLDEKEGWVYQSSTGKAEQKDNVNAGTVATKIVINVSEAAKDFLWRTRSIYRKRPEIKDTTSFERIYNDTGYFYVAKKMVSNKASRRSVDRSSTKWKMKKVLTTKSDYYFSFTSQIGKVRFGSNNPEMSPYRHVTWRLDEKLDKKTIRKLRSCSSGINDLRISYLGGTDYSIELKLPTGFVTLLATPVNQTLKKEHVAVSEKRCLQMNHQYNRILQNRKRGFDNAIRHRVYMFQSWTSRMHQDSLKQWCKSKKLMNDSEMSMDFSTWVNYSRKNVGYNAFDGILSAEQSAQSGAVYQALSVMKFGVYNCDQIQRINNPVQVFALAYSPDNIPQNAAQMFVIDKKRNQVFSYTGFSGDPIPIAFGAKEENKLIVVNADGTIALTDVELFNARKNTPQGNTRFETILMSSKPVSTQDLREFIYPEKIVN